MPHSAVCSLGANTRPHPLQSATPSYACLLQAWQHIKGREGQALEALKRIAAETAAERQQKVGGQAVRQAPLQGSPCRMLAARARVLAACARVRALPSAGLTSINLCCCFLQANGEKANGDHHAGKAAAAAAPAGPVVKPAKAGGRALRSRRKVAVDDN